MRNSFIIYFILLSINLWAQEPYAIELNETKNLPSNTIFDVFNDYKGFIWMATPKGLYKYDGARYQVYKSNQQSSVSGSDIKEDVYNRIWYQNFDGFLFYVKNNKLQALNQNTPVGYIPYGITDKYLFVIQKKGVDVFDLKSLNLIKTIPLFIDVAEHTTVLNHAFYIIADDIIYKIDSKLNVSKSDYFIDKKLHVKYIYPYNNELYVVSKLNETKQIYFFNEDLDFEKAIALPNINYIQGSDYIDHTIWIHTTQGSFAYNLDGELIYRKAILSDKSVSKLVKDYQDNLWFSTINKGISIVPDLNNHIINKHPYALKTLAKYNNSFLLGSDIGELLLTNESFSKKKELHRIAENLPTSFIYYDSLANNIFFSNKGFYLIQKGAFNKGKNYDIALKDIVKIDDKYYAFAASSLCGIFKDPKISNHVKSVWDSVYDEHKSEKMNDIAGLITNVRGKSVLYDELNQAIYYATNTGLFIYDERGLNELKDKNSSFYGTKLLKLKDKIYALNTKGNLYEINRNGLFKNISAQFNLPHEDIQFVKQFNNVLLLACSQTIYTFNGTTLNKINFTNSLHNIYDAYLDSNTLIILTNEGIVSLQLESISQPKKNIFHINRVTINDSLMDLANLKELSYNQNNLRIYFSLLDYVLNQSTIYYRINHGEWVNVNKSIRYLDFPSLAAGKYTIEFKIDDELQPQKIDLDILLPFWKTWWFYTILLILGISLVFIYFKWKSNIMLKQIALLNEKVTLEKDLRNSMLSAIKSQMNPHFFYNALNTIQAYIFKNDKKKANNYLAKFSKLTRIILEMSEKESVYLSHELDAIKLYLDLEQMRFTDDFTYEINIADDVKTENIEFPPMLLQPYVENAIKHGLLHSNKAKKVIINLVVKNQNLIISIDDNGIGRSKSAKINAISNKKHQSFATQAIDKRLEILNKGRSEKISIEYIDKYEQGIATGTTIILTMPIF